MYSDFLLSFIERVNGRLYRDVICMVFTVIPFFSGKTWPFLGIKSMERYLGGMLWPFATLQVSFLWPYHIPEYSPSNVISAQPFHWYSLPHPVSLNDTVLGMSDCVIIAEFESFVIKVLNACLIPLLFGRTYWIHLLSVMCTIFLWCWLSSWLCPGVQFHCCILWWWSIQWIVKLDT